MIEALDDHMCLEIQDTTTRSSHGNGVLANSGYDYRQTTMAGAIGLGMTTSAAAVSSNSGQTMTDEFPPTDFSRQMRTAAVLLAQLQQQDANDPTQVMVHAIRQRVIDQMVALEEQRMQSTTTTLNEPTKLLLTKTSLSKKHRDGDGDGGGGNGSNKSILPLSKQDSRNMVVNKDDPSGKWT